MLVPFLLLAQFAGWISPGALVTIVGLCVMTWGIAVNFVDRRKLEAVARGEERAAMIALEKADCPCDERSRIACIACRCRIIKNTIDKAIEEGKYERTGN